MNKQEFIDKITNSPLSADRKNKILALLSSGELTFDIKEEIKDIIQEDIDSDNTSMSDADKADIAASNVQMETELSAVENDLAGDMQFVEAELNSLEEMVKEVDGIVDQANIESLQSKIQEM
ncbi:hypothetical protein A3C57_01880 [Candidatus Nomurabacteria bacterium RIFCSPHIGHO2_02_FULL_33_12]|uniref:Uncharacterized protein n=1 Tax=Candidatus Nomurabacteria bacterium RIFCSPLOWO2_01_FULL_33_17 TaxID=1801764 RepID=A0A1F6WN52_9BACT|nr:MAG: hypothetical protein A3C57_01880 [Candidatus Nomurabacteria bacterium RIFCSPHIGHO2_02_FULL_33_12]OGI83264.1 MAG: hypothetical protein A2903_02720 [Candidatus Nomurabacteria bacterium RIFCSPLOWO2_01_FULL_33_17]